jgi:hypothetical protein
MPRLKFAYSFRSLEQGETVSLPIRWSKRVPGLL